jgi:hypothetical protein
MPLAMLAAAVLTTPSRAQEPPTTPDPAPITAASAAPPPPTPPLTSGVYGLSMTVATMAKIPVLGTIRALSRQQLLVHLELEGSTWVQHQDMCDMTIDTNARIVRTVLTRAFIDAIPNRRYPLTLTLDGESWRYFADLGIHDFGWDSDGYLPLPQDGDDPGITDDDRDGHPGVTLKLDVPVFGQVDLYVVQHVHTQISGTFTAPDRVEGLVDMRILQQRAVGAGNPLFNRNTETEPVRAESPFLLIKVPETTTCATLPAALTAATIKP